MKYLVLVYLLTGLLTSCSPQSKDKVSEVSSEEKILARAKSVYNANCAVCHGIDPHLLKDGNVGPNVFGSSEELLRSKMLLGVYPQGYTPKKAGGGMPKFPHLEKEISGLSIYLNSKTSP